MASAANPNSSLPVLELGAGTDVITKGPVSIKAIGIDRLFSNMMRARH
jgi:phospholipid N-methyltransferase